MAKNNKPKKKATPSLLEAESRGGDSNEAGLQFQASVTAGYAMRWLAMEGFTQMLREGVADTEAKFYVPGYGFKKECVEAKNHYVAPAEFWQEIDRFKSMDRGTPDEYQWFTLASVGISNDLQPLINSLRRLRDPYGFYDKSSPIITNSYNDYLAVVERLGHDAEDANFLYERVLLDPDLNAYKTDPASVFKGNLTMHHPVFQDLSDRILQTIYNTVSTFIQARLAKTITRVELETVIREAIPENLRSVIPPVSIYSGASDDQDIVRHNKLYLPWADFSGGFARNYPPAQDWNNRLVRQLRETKSWIVSSRNTRRIRLTGSRRISASLAIGFVFPAVEGFSLEMMLRHNELWATDSHPDATTPDYTLIKLKSSADKRAERLVVSLGILRNCSDEVDYYLQDEGLTEIPVFHLYGAEPVLSAKQANLIVRKLKNEISSVLSITGARQIDLFLAVPSQIALFLSHRLNAMAQIQCYEWTAPNTYVHTCLL